jgi:hypothetical protein
MKPGIKWVISPLSFLELSPIEQLKTGYEFSERLKSNRERRWDLKRGENLAEF